MFYKTPQSSPPPTYLSTHFLLLSLLLFACLWILLKHFIISYSQRLYLAGVACPNALPSVPIWLTPHLSLRGPSGPLQLNLSHPPLSNLFPCLFPLCLSLPLNLWHTLLSAPQPARKFHKSRILCVVHYLEQCRIFLWRERARVQSCMHMG